MVNKMELGGIYFTALSKDIILSSKEKLTHIVTVNPEFIVKAQKNEEFRRIINSNYTTIDGQITYFILKLKYLFRKFDKISGCDFIYDLCLLSKKNKYKVFLLGGYEQSNKMSVLNLKNDYGIEIEGYPPVHKPYPFSKEHNDKILEKIEDFKPDIIFVAFGTLKTELWINDNREFLEKLGVKYAMGVGGTFDFISKKVKRAPKIIRKIGFESIYRLYAEPSKYRFMRIMEGLKMFFYIFKSTK
ncbi:MAG: WecB/TagA/CpsF family glycosyltransferase [Desulfobacterales bacterium]|nr:WecB/TagA/CpsF family glycosyltransferase [Desulfobacterales bacterium]